MKQGTLEAVEKLLGTHRAVDVDMTTLDPVVYEDVQRARTRLELHASGIAMDFPFKGSTTMRVYRFSTEG